MSNIKLIETRNEKDYTMDVYEITYPWGVIKSAHFVRPNNVIGSVFLRTVINRWHDAKGQYRSNKKYEIVDNGRIKASVWANSRFDKEKGVEYVINQDEINNFFYTFELEKRISTLEAGILAKY